MRRLPTFRSMITRGAPGNAQKTSDRMKRTHAGAAEDTAKIAVRCAAHGPDLVNMSREAVDRATTFKNMTDEWCEGGTPLNSQSHPFYMRPPPPLPTGLMGEPDMGILWLAPMVGSYGNFLPPHMVAAHQSHMLAWQAAQQPWNWLQPQAPHPMLPHHLQCLPHYYRAARPSHPPQLQPQPQMNPAGSLPSRPREPSASQNSNSNGAGLSRTQRRRRQREALAAKLGIHRRSQNEAAVQPAVAAAAAAEEEPALAAAAASPNQGGSTPAATVPPDQGDTEGAHSSAEGSDRRSRSNWA